MQQSKENERVTDRMKERMIQFTKDHDQQMQGKQLYNYIEF
ncbi:MAG: hypothetical protein CM15mV7_1230 [uncultured marine virus]|nr:MAG: hypothetical protein CM15mV7_1230 [uncultured marine virus]